MTRYRTIASKVPRLGAYSPHTGWPLLSSSTTARHQLGRALYSHQGYGDAPEHPESQGVSPRSRELEHPGPEQAKKKSSNTNKQGGASGRDSGKASDTSKSQNIPSRSEKEKLENELARGRGQ